jgi:hypothetical protein
VNLLGDGLRDALDPRLAARGRKLMALLEIENLQVHFRTPDGVNRAVDGVSFHVNEGETFAVVGESGCGKSVTAMSILRLIPEPPGKIAGSIRFQGKELLELSDREMRGIRGNDISMMFQEPMTSPQPAAHDRPPDRRDLADATSTWAAVRRAPGRSSCCTSSGIARRRAAPWRLPAPIVGRACVSAS